MQIDNIFSIMSAENTVNFVLNVAEGHIFIKWDGIKQIPSEGEPKHELVSISKRISTPEERDTIANYLSESAKALLAKPQQPNEDKAPNA